jgi:hypothetical protein
MNWLCLSADAPPIPNVEVQELALRRASSAPRSSLHRVQAIAAGERSPGDQQGSVDHAAFDFGAHGRAIVNYGATKMLYSMYPSQVQRWINQRGALTSRMIYLRGRELLSMYHACNLDAQASVIR